MATVDLPEPDSPTSAVVVPRRTPKVTSSTALRVLAFPPGAAHVEDLRQVLHAQDLVDVLGDGVHPQLVLGHLDPDRMGALNAVGGQGGRRLNQEIGRAHV